MNPKKKTRRPRGKKQPYSTGEKNRLIDDAVHPWTRENLWLILVDGGLHALVEGDLKTSAVKFAKYSLPELLKKILEKT